MSFYNFNISSTGGFSYKGYFVTDDDNNIREFYSYNNLGVNLVGISIVNTIKFELETGFTDWFLIQLTPTELQDLLMIYPDWDDLKPVGFYFYHEAQQAKLVPANYVESGVDPTSPLLTFVTLNINPITINPNPVSDYYIWGTLIINTDTFFIKVNARTKNIIGIYFENEYILQNITSNQGCIRQIDCSLIDDNFYQNLIIYPNTGGSQNFAQIKNLTTTVPEIDGTLTFKSSFNNPILSQSLGTIFELTKNSSVYELKAKGTVQPEPNISLVFFEYAIKEKYYKYQLEYKSNFVNGTFSLSNDFCQSFTCNGSNNLLFPLDEIQPSNNLSPDGNPLDQSLYEVNTVNMVFVNQYFPLPGFQTTTNEYTRTRICLNANSINFLSSEGDFNADKNQIFILYICDTMNPGSMHGTWYLEYYKNGTKILDEITFDISEFGKVNNNLLEQNPYLEQYEVIASNTKFWIENDRINKLIYVLYEPISLKFPFENELFNLEGEDNPNNQIMAFFDPDSKEFISNKNSISELSPTVITPISFITFETTDPSYNQFMIQTSKYVNLLQNNENITFFVNPFPNIPDSYTFGNIAVSSGSYFNPFFFTNYSDSSNNFIVINSEIILPSTTIEGVSFSSSTIGDAYFPPGTIDISGSITFTNESNQTTTIGNLSPPSQTNNSASIINLNEYDFSTLFSYGNNMNVIAPNGGEAVDRTQHLEENLRKLLLSETYVSVVKDNDQNPYQLRIPNEGVQAWMNVKSWIKNSYLYNLKTINLKPAFNGSSNSNVISNSFLINYIFGSSDSTFDQSIDLTTLSTVSLLEAQCKVDPPVIPIYPLSNICFFKDSILCTDQGYFPIQNIEPEKYTINNKPIKEITKTLSFEKDLICIEKGAISYQVPGENTLISQNHKIWYFGKMKKAIDLLGLNNKIYKVSYNKDVLYNVLLEDQQLININNLQCESLNPNDYISNLYRILKNKNENEKEDVIKTCNKFIMDYLKISSY